MGREARQVVQRLAEAMGSPATQAERAAIRHDIRGASPWWRVATGPSSPTSRSSLRKNLAVQIGIGEEESHEVKRQRGELILVPRRGSKTGGSSASRRCGNGEALRRAIRHAQDVVAGTRRGMARTTSACCALPAGGTTNPSASTTNNSTDYVPSASRSKKWCSWRRWERPPATG